MSSAHRPERELLFLLLLSMLWGASYTFIHLAVVTIPPVTLVALRTLIAACLLWTYALAQGLALPVGSGVWKLLFTQGLLNSVIPFTLVSWSERWVSAGLTTILNSTSPIFVVLIGWFLPRRAPTGAHRLVGAVLGLTGVVLIVGKSAFNGAQAHWLAELVIVLASTSYAGAALFGQRLNVLPPPVAAAGSMTCAALLLVPTSLVVDRPWTLSISTRSALALLALATLSTALAFVIYFRLMKTLGSLGTASQAFLRVPFGVALGVVFLDESLSPSAWAGLCGVLVGVALLTWPFGWSPTLRSRV
jgi:drug/metabolite transporter (DMT)-like permease